jgi:hypothetical protein
MRAHAQRFVHTSDEKHPPQTKEWWDEVYKSHRGMDVHTRPGNLTPAEKKARASKNSKTSYETHREERVAASRASRTEISDAAHRGIALADSVDEMVAVVEELSKTIGVWQKKLRPMDEVIDLDATPSPENFFLFCQYYLPLSRFPLGDAGRRFADSVPTGGQYREISKLMHPDKNPQIDPRAQQLLTASWTLLEELLGVEGGNAACTGPGSWLVPKPAEEETFAAQSDAHAEVLRLRNIWCTLVDDTMDRMTCNTGSEAQCQEFQFDMEAVAKAKVTLTQVKQGKARIEERAQRNANRRSSRPAGQ